MNKSELLKDILVYAEMGILGHPEVTVNATYAEVFSIVSKLVETMAESTAGMITYNQILDDLKEVEPEYDGSY